MWRFWQRWKASRTAGQQLDSLLAAARPDAELVDRNLWAIELSHWVRRGRAPDGSQGIHPQHARLRYLLHVLDRQPETRERFARTLRSILTDNDPTSLFCDTGVASHPGFWGEVWERLQARFVPPAPNRSDMFALFSLVFTEPTDADWLRDMDDDTLRRLQELLQLPDVGGPSNQVPGFEQALTSSMQVLVSQVRATGMSQAIRSRLPGPVAETPFFKLAAACAELCNPAIWRNPTAFGQALAYFRALLEECRISASNVYQELEQNGVSVEVVFQIERMKLRLHRIELLLGVWVDPTQRNKHIHLVIELIHSTQARRSVRHLAATSFAHLARRVMERSAQTGEHYIARDRREYRSMVKAALGGGLFTVVTVYLKFAIYALHAGRFMEGLLASLNYAGSFLAIHFAHFTLATKQPAMTGPALAHRLDAADTPQGREAFVNDTIAMIRSNAAAIFGNLAAVFPVAYAVQWLAVNLLHKPLLTPEKAQQTIDSFSLFGMTPLYAAATGVLLWLSSLAAGWADNWFALRRVHDAMMYNRRLCYALGERGAQRLAGFWQRNISGIAGNVSLGLLLGLGPEIIAFVGPTVEVRHVTLSTGSLGAAIGVLGWGVVDTGAFWQAVAGIALMGVLNVAICFALAFNLALRSRGLKRSDRLSLSRAVRQRIFQYPGQLIWPPRNT
ncbi:site-specific recombinase [Bordetella avium]|uniref:site-specific recombinase n=1 Tax=Bordetella avium TaxID=521 RepID=UPI000E67F4CB|nr:site-specific recombinase [Bordetella avium]RIQ19258.1 recombinase [Bordetella avium]RIQ33426.1 recombinase [Bordetella avium]RIQ69514.1 recombinase [Bordetella avium]